MGKRHKKHETQPRRQVVWSKPDFLHPVCPTCGKAAQLVDESDSEWIDDPMFECTRCWVRFMFEDSAPEKDDDAETAEANINTGTRADPPVLKLKCAICLGKGCEVCKPKAKKDTKEYQTEPAFGEMEELT
mgnify:CR=1 FL=1